MSRVWYIQLGRVRKPTDKIAAGTKNTEFLQHRVRLSIKVQERCELLTCCVAVQADRTSKIDHVGVKLSNYQQVLLNWKYNASTPYITWRSNLVCKPLYAVKKPDFTWVIMIKAHRFNCFWIFLSSACLCGGSGFRFVNRKSTWPLVWPKQSDFNNSPTACSCDPAVLFIALFNLKAERTTLFVVCCLGVE